jgi:hypothetical protein
MSNRRNPNARGIGRIPAIRPVVPAPRPLGCGKPPPAASPARRAISQARPIEFELHHITYSGVVQGQRWVAGGGHEDLIPLHPLCHELLHWFIDTDPILARHRSREDATAQALPKVLARVGGMR